VSFLSVLIIGEPLSLYLYILIGNILSPFFLILWIVGFTEMTHQDKRGIIILIYSIILTITEVYLIYYLITDYTQLGIFTGTFDIKYSYIMVAYLLFIVLSVFITGTIFAWESLRMDDPVIKFRAKMLLLAFLTYPICGLLDAGIDLTEVSLIIVRSILISGAILFYLGFFKPKFIKKRLKLE